MKRIHIGLEVKDLESSIDFYSALFGAQPSHRESDYAKWMLACLSGYHPHPLYVVCTHFPE